MDSFHYQPFYPACPLPPPAAHASSSSSSSFNQDGGPLQQQAAAMADEGERRKTRRRGGGVRLSTDPQSVAARERRHRISDRFKILQSLVPGGSKMDTVSMLEEAIHYVKFLKAQIWLHQALMAPSDQAPATTFPPPETAAPPFFPQQPPQQQQQQQLPFESTCSPLFSQTHLWDYQMEDDASAHVLPTLPRIHDYYP